MNKKRTLELLLIILCIVLVFHLLILTEIIPYDQVWAGKLESTEEMRYFETISIIVIAFMITVLSMKYKQLAQGIKNKVIDIFIWIFAGFFALNTIGNLFSKSTTELILGTLLTLTSSILCLVIVKKKKPQLK